jgi:hypothetical protein
MRMFLQRFQGFIKQSRDRLTGLARQRGQDAFLFGREFKGCLFHRFTVPEKGSSSQHAYRENRSNRTQLRTHAPQLAGKSSCG